MNRQEDAAKGSIKPNSQIFRDHCVAGVRALGAKVRPEPDGGLIQNGFGIIPIHSAFWHNAQYVFTFEIVRTNDILFRPKDVPRVWRRYEGRLPIKLVLFREGLGKRALIPKSVLQGL